MVKFIVENNELDTSGSSEIYSNKNDFETIPSYRVMEITPDAPSIGYVHNLSDRTEEDIDTFYASVVAGNLYRITITPSPTYFFKSNISIWIYIDEGRDLVFNDNGASMYIDGVIYSEVFEVENSDELYIITNIRQSDYQRYYSEALRVSYDAEILSDYKIELITINSAPTGNVLISGLAEENNTLTADVSNITDSDGLGNFRYQWYKRPDWSDTYSEKITDATTSSYTLSEDDIGDKLFLRVSYTDGKGREQFIDSDITDEISNVNDAPTGQVTIEKYSLDIAVGDRIYAETDISDLDQFYSSKVYDSEGEFQWYRDNVAIPNATDQSYAITTADLGKNLSVVFTYTDDRGTVESVASQTDAVVAVVPENIVFTDSADTFNGTDLPEIITSRAGDDTIKGDGGNDQIDGGEGFDTAVYSGNQSSYTVQLSSSGVTITDRRENQDGTDELINFENLRFKDGDFNIDIRTGAADLPPEDFAAIVELYIAYFNRAPASKGLLYWADRLEDDMPLPKIAESFFVQPETQATYAAYLDEDGNLLDTEAFVTAVFNNVLGRDPYGPYWINELDNNPAITPAIFILAVLNGAKAPTGGAEDREYLANKIDIGIYFSAIKGLSDYDDTISVMNIFDGSEESVSAAVSEIDEIYAAAQDGDTGEFIMPLIGVVDNPFEIM